MWHNGVGSSPAFSSLPEIRSLKAFHNADGMMTLNQLARAPKKAHRVFAWALAEFYYAAIINNANIDSTVKVRITVWKGYSASDWIPVHCRARRRCCSTRSMVLHLHSSLVFRSKRLARAPHASTYVSICAHAL